MVKAEAWQKERQAVAGLFFDSLIANCRKSPFGLLGPASLRSRDLRRTTSP
jgi:hypothetical protein